MAALTSLEIARAQLKHAIALLMKNEELVSAITLAGAAEEILGSLVAEANLVPALYRRTERARNTYKAVWGKDPGPKPFLMLKNRIRNELKHRIARSLIEFDPRMEATRMLDRAVENYQLLCGCHEPFIRRYQRFRQMLRESDSLRVREGLNSGDLD